MGNCFEKLCMEANGKMKSFVVYLILISFKLTKLTLLYSSTCSLPCHVLANLTAWNIVLISDVE